MKKLSLLTILILLATLSFSQVTKERLDQGTVGNLVEGEWEWTEWDYCNILCVVDMNNSNVKIYSKTIQDYDIISDREEYNTDEGWEQIKYSAVDAYGTVCLLFFMNDDELGRFIGIEYTDTRVMYHIKSD